MKTYDRETSPPKERFNLVIGRDDIKELNKISIKKEVSMASLMREGVKIIINQNKEDLS